MTIHTFGDYCRWHPHVHGIVADGLFYGSGLFYVMPKNVDLDNLAAIFRANVLQMLKKEGKIDETMIKKIMGWRYMSGFSVHNGVRIARDDEDGKEGVAQYIIRNPFSEAKLTYKESAGMVIYKSKMTHGKDKRNFLVVDAEEFIALITQHIPEKSHQLVRYYGFYSNRIRGERRKEAEQEKYNRYSHLRGGYGAFAPAMLVYITKYLFNPIAKKLVFCNRRPNMVKLLYYHRDVVTIKSHET